ncbi:MAG TPA: Ldh family oxidoreductase [Candidatus Acidoferrales bacterium]|jgi:LDH2 family malate/lactate/ureidoglycolate dehydrogenase|nr:Ldh family oxidoreductase [Candidatus Acidoferrales bacterium]
MTFPLETSVVVSSEDERALIVHVLATLGASERKRSIQADVLTEADLRGHHSHGLQRLPVLATRIKNRLIRVDADPAYVWTADSVLSVDGKDGLGPFVAESALERAKLAGDHRGIVAVAIRNSSHLGMIGYYCEKRAREGLICLAMTESEALVHPHGGTKALVGTNPIAIGIPSESAPFVFDMATSTSAIGKLYASKHRGESIPPGWAIDAEGNPTTNPDAALKGSLTPAAGPKGYGLGISIGILAGLLPGGEIGRLVLGTLDTESRCTKGDLFLLLNPAAFAGGPTLATRVASYLDELRHSPPQQGCESVIVPGDRARNLREQRLRTGIPLPKQVWQAAERLKNEF